MDSIKRIRPELYESPAPRERGRVIAREKERRIQEYQERVANNQPLFKD